MPSTGSPLGPAPAETAQLQALVEQRFEMQALMAEHPPRFHHPNKRVVFQIACPPGTRHRGTLRYSRWPAQDLPPRFGPQRAALQLAEDYFDYHSPPPESGRMAWYLNFAHDELFFAYGGPLFAQDEIQVAEHPCLGALREALLARGLVPLIQVDGRPTPALVIGAQRCCQVATDPDADALRPFGLYGNAFARATPTTVARATRRIAPPTLSNILAIAAPSYGRGPYSPETIDEVLVTAYSGFRAAVVAGRRDSPASPPATEIHTGYWGCGAFGGNRVLMSLLQILAAHLAQVDRLVFHSGRGAARPYLQAQEILESLLPPGSLPETAELRGRIAAMGFEWGVSDGN